MLLPVLQKTAKLQICSISKYCEIEHEFHAVYISRHSSRYLYYTYIFIFEIFLWGEFYGGVVAFIIKLYS